jgi:secreted trypsin-like serine protease
MPVEGQSLPIINGAPPTRPEHDSVVALHSRYVNVNAFSPSPFCSGTLISPTVVLTAAHCLDAANGGPSFKARNADTIAVYVGDDPSADFAGNHFAVDQVLIHPDYDRWRLRNDIGLLRLASPQSGTTVPNLPLDKNFTAGDIGTQLNFSGFGYSDTAKTEFGEKLQADTPLGGLGCSVAGCPSGQPTNTQISYLQTDDGPCNGDSGGPAFIDRAGTWYVGGVTSYGDGSCSQYGASTNAAAFEAWINAFEDGGAPPPPPSACGDSDVCEAGESCDGRFGTTACSECDGKTGGKPSTRFCYVGGVCEGPGCP